MQKARAKRSGALELLPTSRFQYVVLLHISIARSIASNLSKETGPEIYMLSKPTGKSKGIHIQFAFTRM